MNYLTREQWGAEFNVTPVPTIHTPVRYLFTHHNVIAPTNNPAHDMLTTERVDINRFGKPSYDWGIHPSGTVLEGMTNHLSPDTFGHNSDSLSIMFMGNFENDIPTDAAILAGRELVQFIRTLGWMTDSTTMWGHRDVYSTACPGANLYPRIQELMVPPLLPHPLPIPVTGDNDMVFIIAPDNEPNVAYVIDTSSGFIAGLTTGTERDELIKGGAKGPIPVNADGWAKIKDGLKQVRMGSA